MLNKLQEIAKLEPWKVRPALLAFIEENKDEIPTEKPRTLTQNAAMWKQHQLVADELTKLGVSMRKIFEETESFDIPPSKDNVHQLWLYFQQAMYPELKSTRDLPKNGEHFQKIHDVMMKNLGETFHMEYIDFPCDEQRHLEENQGYKTGGKVEDYPDEYEGPPTI